LKKLFFLFFRLSCLLRSRNGLDDVDSWIFVSECVGYTFTAATVRKDNQ